MLQTAEHYCASPAESVALARELAEESPADAVVAFYGDLGSGKTFLIREICLALGVVERPTSPTFTIINEYHTADGETIYHFDFYRITHEAELVNLGLEDYFYSGNRCFIEWADRIAAHLPRPRYEVHISADSDAPEGRTVAVSRVG